MAASRDQEDAMETEEPDDGGIGPSTQEVLDASQVSLSPVESRHRDAAMDLCQHQADVGVVEEVTLVDFMCHKKLTVSLSPNVNFILGQNGSGKSAIMTAIVVALGGKAASTQRGSSLKQFIRTSCRQAEITLKLRNRGTDAYKPAEYGSTIIVVRQIRSDGTTSYKLKSNKGHTVSTTKDELIRMLECFNIQINNPVSMLNQDTSRNFLHSSNPAAKFKLFMRGTHLEQIAHDYARSEEHQQIMRNEIARKKEMLSDLQLEAKKWEEEVRTIDQLVKAEERVKQLSEELMWAAVSKLQQSVDKSEQDVNTSRKKVSKDEERLEKAQTKVNEKKDHLGVVRSELEEATNSVKQVDQQLTKQLEEKRGMEKSVRDTKTKLLSTRKEIGKVEREKIAYIEKLDELRLKSQRDIAGEKEAVKEQMEQAEQQLVNVEQRLSTAERDKRNKEEELNTVSEEHRRHRFKLDDLRQQLSECDDIVARLQGNQNQSRLQGYPRWMIDLVNFLQQNQRQFRRPPKGPLGAAISLREQKWSTAVESVIGFSLYSFIVDNRQDEFTFNRLVRQWMSHGGGARRPPSCICSAFEGRVFDTSQTRSHGPYPTVFDQIVVDDPDVMNTLIDLNNVDTVLLIADKAEARRVMYGNPPTNSTSAYTIEGDQVMAGGRYYSNKSRSQGIVRASVKESLVYERNKREGIAQHVRSAEEEDRLIGRKLSDGKALIRKMVTCIQQAQSGRHKWRMELDKLKSKLEEMDQNAEEDIITWESEVQECEDKLRELARKREMENDELKQSEQLLANHKEEMDRYKRNVEDVHGRVERMKTRLRAAVEDKDKAERFKMQCEERIATHTATLQREENQLNEAQRQLDDAKEQAEQHCPEIVTSRAPDSIRSEIRKLESHLHSQQERRQNQLEIRQKYVAAMDKYEKTVDEIRLEKKTLTGLQSGLDRRKNDYAEMQRRIAQRCVLYFNNYVRRRGYQGALKFDIPNKQLEIIVKVSGDNQVTKNTRSLSGGERSFATVSFIMALWEAIECPFRCLDEFDVFMDLMNRRISMQLMIESADQQKNRQFIFFTPQDMSSLGIKYGPSTKVLRLDAPDRRQSTLNI